jgi:hypothetical protein
LSGETYADGKITMKPYGVAVLRLQELTGKKA